jgi:hypothetical protein
VLLTEQGRALAPAVETPLTTAQLLERIYGLISTPQGKLLQVLARGYPRTYSREELADAAGVSSLSSGYEKNVSTLSARGLVTYPERGSVRAAEWIFEHEEAAAGGGR